MDVGGNAKIWDLLKEYFNLSPKRLLLLNKATGENYGSYEYVLGDARQLPYPDQSFDLVFSNSAIEHVGKEEDQSKFVKECERVGKEIYIQTPNHWFPIETHLVTIFIHWLPKNLYKKLSFLSLLYICRIRTKTICMPPDQWIDNLNLLSKRQIKKLFPGKKIYEERVLGLNKSFIVSSRNLDLPVIK